MPVGASDYHRRLHIFAYIPDFHAAATSAQHSDGEGRRMHRKKLGRSERRRSQGLAQTFINTVPV